MAEELRLTQRADGELDGTLQWGEEVDPEPVLVHAISVPLTPVPLGDQATDDEPLLRLHSIRFAVRSWRELAGRTFPFPNEVGRIDGDGESNPVYDIYGSLRLGDHYHPVLMTGITFGRYEACRVAASLRGRVESDTQPPGFTPTDFRCEASLTVQPVFVRGDLRSSTLPDAAEAERLATRLLRLDDYRSPRSDNGRVRIAPRC